MVVNNLSKPRVTHHPDVPWALLCREENSFRVWEHIQSPQGQITARNRLKLAALITPKNIPSLGSLSLRADCVTVLEVCYI